MRPHPVEWLMIEWPDGEAGPRHNWVSTLPAETDLAALVDIAKLRWRIERDDEELKAELGLPSAGHPTKLRFAWPLASFAHYEGRSWRGFHHHATLSIAAYGFLIGERAAFPPSGALFGKAPRLPDRPRPGGASGPPRTPRRDIDRHPQKKDRRRSRQNAQTMSMLSRNPQASLRDFVTQ